jgi:putative nucleotidyltransferase with HDIG domain
MSALTSHLDVATERRIEESLERRRRKLDRRERIGLPLLAGSFLVAALALALVADAARELSPPLALAFVAAYAVADRIEFSSGAGYTVPTQLVLVPMLLLLPTPAVPLLVALGLVTSSAWEAIEGGTAPGRSLVTAVADAWYALAPAVVLVAAGAQLPEWDHWPAYAAALAAQFATATAALAVRTSLYLDLSAKEMLGELRLALRVDLLLAPIGLLAAIAAADAPAAALLVLALVPLLLGFERERESRIENSLELGRAYRGTALLLRDLIEEDDEYTGRHTEDVVALAVRVAERMGVDDETRRAVELGALLHDIGKIAVPDEIINKPGPLDDEEWAIMRTHTVEGQRMLDQVGGLLAGVGVVVRASHERWDGGGYPDGLAGDDIPLAAQIVSACDAYNAMTTDRSYRKALTVDVAVAELERNAGSQFAPDVVRALVAIVRETEQPGWQLGLLTVEAEPQPVEQT